LERGVVHVSALDEVRELAEAVTRRRSLTLWDVEMGGQPGRSVVRVFVATPDGRATGGVDLDTVAQISEEISRGLDLKDPIPGRYTLEVSTPGLERTLRLPEHFARSIGDKVVIKTTEVLVGNSHRIDGTIAAAGDGAVTVGHNGGEVDVPYDRIKSARTVFEW
jgi:ribosome maturation factor RimP